MFTRVFSHVWISEFVYSAFFFYCACMHALAGLCLLGCPCMDVPQSFYVSFEFIVKVSNKLGIIHLVSDINPTVIKLMILFFVHLLMTCSRKKHLLFQESQLKAVVGSLSLVSLGKKLHDNPFSILLKQVRCLTF